MKRLFLFIFIINSTLLFGQSSINTIKLHTRDSIESWLISNVDSITHNSLSLTVHTYKQSSVFNVDLVDSLVLTTTPSKYYQIEEANLEGWSVGYIDENDCFITLKEDSVGSGYYVFLGQKNAVDDGIIFHFHKDFSIHSIYSTNGHLNVIKDDNTERYYGVYILNTKDSLYIKEMSFDTIKNKRQVVGTISPQDALNLTINWISGAMTIEDFRQLILNGNGYMNNFIAGFIPSLVMSGPVVSLGLSILLNYWEQRYQDQYYELIRKYMGGAMVWISDIKDAQAPIYDIEISVDKLNTFDTPIIYSLRTGLAVKMNESNVTYDDCSSILEEHAIKSNEVYNANLSAIENITYYVRPYIIVMLDGIIPSPLTRSKYLFGGPQIPYITYGDVDKILYTINPNPQTGGVTTLADKMVTIECSYYNLPQNATCGVKYTWDGGESQQIVSSSEGTQSITLSGLTPATTYTYRAFVQVNGETYYGADSTFTTLPPKLPDLSGTWTFDQTYFGENSLTVTLELQSSTATSATYKAKAGFYGVNSLSVTVSIDQSGSIATGGPYGYAGSFQGTFNEDFTNLSGDKYYYATPSWANPGWWVEESWSLHR